MSIDLPDLAELKAIGAPYHGLWKAGNITLPNGSTKAAPAPANGASVLLRVPGQPDVVRTPAELADDVANGLEWRNYGLVSGGRYAGSALLYPNDSYAYVMLIDAANKVWRLRIQFTVTSPIFTVSVMRFGLIDGTTAAWSPAVNVDFPIEFYSSVFGGNPPATIAQNTTGREFVLGTPGWTWSMVKVNISGTVNLSAADLGLTWAMTMIEYPNRQNRYVNTSSSVSGICTSTATLTYQEKDSHSIPTGISTDRKIVYIDGSLTSDDGVPVNQAPNYWSFYSQSIVNTSNKVAKQTYAITVKRYVTACYFGDALQLIANEYVYDQTDIAQSAIVNQNGTDFWELAPGIQTVRIELNSWVGSTKVNSQVQTQSGGTGGFNLHRMYSQPFQSNFLDGYSTSSSVLQATPMSHDEIVLSGEQFYKNGAVDTWFSEFLQPVIGGPSNIWQNPSVVLVRRDRTGDTSTYVFTTKSVYAPSCTSFSTNIPISQLHVAWQPVTDQIVVDTQNICWF